MSPSPRDTAMPAGRSFERCDKETCADRNRAVDYVGQDRSERLGGLDEGRHDEPAGYSAGSSAPLTVSERSRRSSLGRSSTSDATNSSTGMPYGARTASTSRRSSSRVSGAVVTRFTVARGVLPEFRRCGTRAGARAVGDVDLEADAFTCAGQPEFDS